MVGTLTAGEEAQLQQTIEMFEVITQSQPQDYQSLEILKEAYFKLGRQKDVVQTSKRIAQAYVQLGQLSSAILEYETILQRFPDDPDVKNALAEIENKANSLTALPMGEQTEVASKPSGRAASRGPTEVDDGKQAMQKLFVDSKLISMGDFDSCWPSPPLHDPPGRIYEPFIQVLADKGILPLDKSLKAICDKSRLGYFPLDKYEFDIETARTFPKEVCQRWCMVPFDRMSKAVMVGTANPFNKQAVAELQQSTQHRVLLYMAPPQDLVKLLRKVFR